MDNLQFYYVHTLVYINNIRKADNKLKAFYGTRNFICLFTRCRHSSPLESRPHPQARRSAHFPTGFPVIPHLPHNHHTSLQFHTPISIVLTIPDVE